MPFDPNDPNQGSQAPIDQSDPGTQAAITQVLNSRLRADPQIGSWLSQHNDGRGLSPNDAGQLKQLVLSRYGNAGLQDFTIAPDGTFQGVKAANDFFPTLLKGSAAVFGPVAGAALFGGSAASAAGGFAPGTGSTVASGLGAASGAAPAAAGGVSGFFSNPTTLIGLAGTLGNVFTNIYGANKQQENNTAALAAQKYATDAAITQQGKTDAQQYAEFQAQQALAQQAQQATEKNNAAALDFQKQQAGISQDEWQKQFGLTSQQAAAAQDLASKQYEQSKAQFDATQALSQKAFDFQKAQYDAAEARKAPYRAASTQALSSLGTLLGLNLGGSTGTTAAGSIPPANSGPSNPMASPLIQQSLMAQKQQAQGYQPVIPMRSLMRGNG